MTEPINNGGGNLDLAARLGSKVRAYRDKAKTAEQKAASLESEKAELERKLKELTEKAGAVTDKDRRIQELESEIRIGKHRAAFHRIAKDAGVNPNALDDAYALSGYKPEGEPDEAKIKEVVESQREARAFLFGKQGPGPGATRGGETEGDNGGMGFTDEQLKDPSFVFANYERIAKATKEKLASK